MMRLASTVALLVLGAVAAGLSAQGGSPEPKAPAKPPVLTRQEALEQFRKLTAKERLQRVEKAVKEDAFVPVIRGDLEVLVTERGMVEVADAIDVVCQVKARAQGSTLATSVVSVIKDGTFVKKGDTLVTLDDSSLKDQLRTQTITVEHAKEARAAADEGLALARKHNELDVRDAEIAFKEAALALKRFDGKDADEKEILTLKVEQAKLRLEVARLHGKTTEATAAARAAAKAAVVTQEEGRRKEILAEIQACVIKAPRAGLAVYYIPEQARWGVGSRQSIVAEGEPVSEGQKLLRICGLKRFVVNTKVHEALISRVRVGQPAVVRVDPAPDKPLRGRVQVVAHVASAPDFLSADVKVFAVQVALDQMIEGLRPGTTAEVRITTDKRPKVLAVPAQSVLHLGGGFAFCFVKTDKGIVERKLKVGVRGDLDVEVKEGLEEGELVLRDPRAVVLLSARPPAKDKPGARGQAWPRATSVLVRSVRPKASSTAPRQRVETYGLTYKDLERIEALPNVAAVVPVRRFSMPVHRLERVVRKGQLFATVPEYRDFDGLQVAAGRFLLADDDSRTKNVAVLGADVSERLFPEKDAVGKVVRLDKYSYEVVGVLREQGAPSDPQTAASVNKGVFIPLRTCKARFGERVILREAGAWSAESVPLHEILVAARKPEQVPLLVENITTLLEEGHPRKDWTISRPSPPR